MFGLMTRKTINAATSGKEISMTTMTTKSALIENLARLEELETINDKIAAGKTELATLQQQIADGRRQFDEIHNANVAKADEGKKLIAKIEAEKMRIMADIPAEITRRAKMVDAVKAFVNPMQKSEPYLVSRGWTSIGGGRWRDPADAQATYDWITAVKVQAKNDLHGE